MDDGGIVGDVELLREAGATRQDRDAGSAARRQSLHFQVIEGDLQTRLKPALERLEAFEDTQAAMYLLRVSFSIVRATHHMRTTREGDRAGGLGSPGRGL